MKPRRGLNGGQRWSTAFSKVLVPIDFSDTTEAALDYARQIALDTGAELHLVHVVNDSMLLLGWPDHATMAVSERRDHASSAVRQRLQDLFTPYDRKHLRTNVHVMSARPGLSIPQFARVGGFDVIVIGTHGPGLVTRILLATTAPCRGTGVGRSLLRCQ